MNKLKPTDMMSDKRNKNADQTIKDAVNTLALHSFLTSSEHVKILKRVESWERDFYSKYNKAN